MKNMRKIESVVKWVLEDSKEARDDDFILILMVYEKLDDTVMYRSFDKIMRQHAHYKLPSFESITRARRKIQNEYPELRSSKRMKEIRNKEQDAFHDYATNGWTDFDDLTSF